MHPCMACCHNKFACVMAWVIPRTTAEARGEAGDGSPPPAICWRCTAKKAAAAACWSAAMTAAIACTCALWGQATDQRRPPGAVASGAGGGSELQLARSFMHKLCCVASPNIALMRSHLRRHPECTARRLPPAQPQTPPQPTGRPAGPEAAPVRWPQRLRTAWQAGWAAMGRRAACCRRQQPDALLAEQRCNLQRCRRTVLRHGCAAAAGSCAAMA